MCVRDNGGDVGGMRENRGDACKVRENSGDVGGVRENRGDASSCSRMF